MSYGHIWSKACRNFFEIVAVLSYLILAAYFIYKYLAINHGMQIQKIDQDIQLKAIDLYFEKIKLFGTLSISILGGMWALVFLEKGELKNRFLFILINLFHVTVLGIFVVGQDFLIGRMFHHKTLEIGAPIVMLWDDAQNLYFLTGAFLSSLWLFKERSSL